MPLSETEIYKIRQEAEKEASLHFNPKYSRDSWQACVSCYTAAVTAERERAKKAEEIIQNAKLITWLCETNGTPVDGFRFRELVIELRNQIKQYEQ